MAEGSQWNHETVVVEGPEPFKADDRIIAVSNRPVENVGELLVGLGRCLCEGAPEGGECTLVDVCLEPDTTLVFTVVRDVTGQGPRHVEVTSNIGIEAPADSE